MAQKRRSRVERIMNRGGLPLLALVGPLGVGTQLSAIVAVAAGARAWPAFLWIGGATLGWCIVAGVAAVQGTELLGDRKSTRLNSSHVAISYAVFCLKKKNKK